MSLKLSDMRAIDGHIVCDIDEHDIPFVLMSAYFVFNICYKKVVIICASFFELSLLNIKTKLPPFSEAILSEFRKLHDPTDNVDIIIIDRLLLSPSVYRLLLSPSVYRLLLSPSVYRLLLSPLYGDTVLSVNIHLYLHVH